MKSKNISILKSKVIYIIARLSLGGIFIYSGIYKITNLQEFSEVVKNLNIFSGFFINTIIFVLPWIELVLGILLVGI